MTPTERQKAFELGREASGQNMSCILYPAVDKAPRSHVVKLMGVVDKRHGAMRWEARGTYTLSVLVPQGLECAITGVKGAAGLTSEGGRRLRYEGSTDCLALATHVEHGSGDEGLKCSKYFRLESMARDTSEALGSNPSHTLVLARFAGESITSSCTLQVPSKPVVLNQPAAMQSSPTILVPHPAGRASQFPKLAFWFTFSGKN
jgi:hypothetical protein